HSYRKVVSDHEKQGNRRSQGVKLTPMGSAPAARKGVSVGFGSTASGLQRNCKQLPHPCRLARRRGLGEVSATPQTAMKTGKRQKGTSLLGTICLLHFDRPYYPRAALSGSSGPAHGRQGRQVDRVEGPVPRPTELS